MPPRVAHHVRVVRAVNGTPLRLRRNQWHPVWTSADPPHQGRTVVAVRITLVILTLTVGAVPAVSAAVLQDMVGDVRYCSTNVSRLR